MLYIYICSIICVFIMLRMVLNCIICKNVYMLLQIILYSTQFYKSFTDQIGLTASGRA